MTLSKNNLEDIASIYSTISIDENKLFEDICTTICVSLLSEGYSAADILDYINYASEDELAEYYLNSDITNLSEEIISEEYFIEQFELLSEALPLIPALAAGAKLAGKVLLGKGARAAVAKGASAVGKGLATAAKRALGPGGRKMVGGAVSKLKGAASAAKGSLSKLPGPVKTAGKWALGGAAFEAGSRGAKKLMGDGDKASAKSAPTPKAPTTPKDRSPSISSPRSSTKTPPSPKPAATPAAKPTDGAERRTPTSAELRAAQGARKSALEAGKSREDAEKAAVQAGIDRGTKLMGGPEGPGKIDTGDVQRSLKSAQEKEKKKNQKTTEESYDAFDLVLEYLIDNGHAETVTEAAYIMTEMDTETIQSIIENRGMSYSGGKPGASGDGNRPKGITGGKIYKMPGWDEKSKPQVKGV
jgi:hypothetical protein